MLFIPSSAQGPELRESMLFAGLRVVFSLSVHLEDTDQRESIMRNKSYELDVRGEAFVVNYLLTSVMQILILHFQNTL